MSDTQSDLEPEPLDAEFEPADDSTRARRPIGGAAAIIVFLLASVTGGGLGFAAGRVFPADLEVDESGPAAERAALVQHLTGLETRLAAIESEDPGEIARQAASASMTTVSARLDALEVASPVEQPAADLAGFETRLAALEARPVRAGETAQAFDPSSLEARLDALESVQTGLQADVSSAAGLASEALQSGIDPQVLSTLSDRVGTLEAAAQTPRSTAGDDALTALTVRIESLEAALADARQLAEGAVASANTARTTADNAAQTASASVEASQSGAAQSNADRTLAARALALTALREMANSGAPFEAERAALARLWRGNPALAQLADHSRAGVLTIRELSESYPGDSIRDADSGSTRLWGLIEFQRVDPDSDETGTLALTALSETRLAEGDLDAAITVTERLEGPALDGAREWLVQARARRSVNAAIDTLRSQLTETAADRGADPT